jgi:nitrite reductase/ring-hydroxylating ferredoxin subunit
MSWQRTGVKDVDLTEGQLRGITVGGTSIVLARLGGSVRALQGACPHLGGDLSEGTLELGKLTCPLHGATFDVATGAVRADPFGISPPEGGVEPVAVYAARVADGEVEVDL